MIDARDYAAVKRAYDKGDAGKKELERFEDSPVLDEVKRNAFALHLERTKGVRAEWKPPEG